MNSLIQILNKLQDVFTETGISNTISLPQIVVVGSQSSGKSSVLEHVIGKDFLPRGSGIVTRRPLIVQCVQKNVINDYGQFEHIPNTIFTDFNQIRDEITKETERTCPGKSVSSIPIRLRIFSSHLVDLTLVDLPGLIKVTVTGQSTEMVDKLRQMVLEFISQKNALILAVTAGNIDIANSDALSIAKEVDPKGERTIGVLTKLDLEDKGTNSMNVLMGKVYPLQLGYIGVVNRSQKDINEGVSINESLRREHNFFQNHEVYSSITDRMGTLYMVKRLNILLINHIKKCLPQLITSIKSTYDKLETRYDVIKVDDENLLSICLQQIMKFTSAFTSALSGSKTNVHVHEVTGGAKIFNVFEQSFRPSINQQNILKGIDDTDILTAIKNASGLRRSLYVPQSAFEMLVKRQVKEFEFICHSCVDNVYIELKEIILTIANENILKYNRFKDTVIDESTVVMNNYTTTTHAIVQDLIDIESDYINTSHPDFDTTKVFKEVEETMKLHDNSKQQMSSQYLHYKNKQSLSQSHFSSKLNQTKEQPEHYNNTVISLDITNSKEMREINLIKNLCTNYLLIVRKHIGDLIPKAIIHFLVNKTRDNIQKRINQTIVQ
ncbi:Dynamin [Entamoeba marina]